MNKEDLKEHAMQEEAIASAEIAMNKETHQTVEAIISETISDFENAFVDVLAEEDGPSRWRKKSNPDKIPEMLRNALTKVAHTAQEQITNSLVEKVALALPDMVDKYFPKGETVERGNATLLGCYIIKVIKDLDLKPTHHE